jgi:hypothetical protein
VPSLCINKSKAVAVCILAPKIKFKDQFAATSERPGISVLDRKARAAFNLPVT